MKRIAIVCNKCGKKDYPDLYYSPWTTKLMIKNCLCNTCANWSEIINRKEGDMIIIDGVAYSFLPQQKNIMPNSTLGYNGEWLFALKKDGKVIGSNDVWRLGVPPDSFLNEFNNGWFISRKAYNIIRIRKNMCHKRGCLDRFHCYLYDIATERDKRFNKVPKDYIIGSEKCPVFVNITKDIKHYNVLNNIDSNHLSL